MELHVADFYFPHLQLLRGEMTIRSEKGLEYDHDIVAAATCLQVVHCCKLWWFYCGNHLRNLVGLMWKSVSCLKFSWGVIACNLGLIYLYVQMDQHNLLKEILEHFVYYYLNEF